MQRLLGVGGVGLGVFQELQGGRCPWSSEVGGHRAETSYYEGWLPERTLPSGGCVGRCPFSSAAVCVAEQDSQFPHRALRLGEAPGPGSAGPSGDLLPSLLAGPRVSDTHNQTALREQRSRPTEELRGPLEVSPQQEGDGVVAVRSRVLAAQGPRL